MPAVLSKLYRRGNCEHHNGDGGLCPCAMFVAQFAGWVLEPNTPTQACVTCSHPWISHSFIQAVSEKPDILALSFGRAGLPASSCGGFYPASTTEMPLTPTSLCACGRQLCDHNAFAFNHVPATLRSQDPSFQVNSLPPPPTSATSGGGNHPAQAFSVSPSGTHLNSQVLPGNTPTVRHAGSHVFSNDPPTSSSSVSSQQSESRGTPIAAYRPYIQPLGTSTQIRQDRMAKNRADLASSSSKQRNVHHPFPGTSGSKGAFGNGTKSYQVAMLPMTLDQRYQNVLPEPDVIHLHGLELPSVLKKLQNMGLLFPVCIQAASGEDVWRNFCSSVLSALEDANYYLPAPPPSSHSFLPAHVKNLDFESLPFHIMVKPSQSNKQGSFRMKIYDSLTHYNFERVISGTEAGLKNSHFTNPFTEGTRLVILTPRFGHLSATLLRLPNGGPTPPCLECSGERHGCFALRCLQALQIQALRNHFEESLHCYEEVCPPCQTCGRGPSESSLLLASYMLFNSIFSTRD
ncbi:hypothetical protein K474DRAFT_1092116 [Panus rudis PR-1116 ss-1]|nr:hypothetical protein K474DRAFT_1092116 [Panus rudis PR-1116 ss-1]